MGETLIPWKARYLEAKSQLDVWLEVRINGDRINGLFHLLVLIKCDILGL